MESEVKINFYKLVKYIKVINEDHSAAQKARFARNVKKPQIDVLVIDMGYDRMEL